MFLHRLSSSSAARGHDMNERTNAHNHQPHAHTFKERTTTTNPNKAKRASPITKRNPQNAFVSASHRTRLQLSTMPH